MIHNLKIKKYIQTLEALSQSTDDYLFVWDIKQDRNWFFGDIDKDFAIRKEGSAENSVEEMFAITHPNDKALLREDLEAVISGEKLVHDLSYRWMNRNGKPVWVSCRGNVIHDDDGTPMVLIGRVSRSVFENKVNRITGMFNKRKMLEDSQAEQFMTKDGYVLFLGLDKLLKSYSEYGRRYMENIIENCARILEEMTGANRYLYHAEDAIFVVCFKDAIAEDIQSFYADLIKKLNKQCTITAVALPSNKQYFTDERELYEAAIEELIKAKKTRRAKLSFFSKKSIVEQINERFLEDLLEQSANNDFEGFYICYQPQIRGTDYTLDGVEALMRFRANGIEYSPAQFIPILEQLGLIHNAGIWVLKTALAQVAIWREQIPNLRLNVNFSLGQFSDPDAIESVIKIYKESHLPPHVLTVELTETVQVEDIDQIVIATRTWQAAGIDVALDDFGKGYSNLVMLKEISCNEIKIERAFISRIKKGTYSYLLASSIINFAHQNDICVCCEGVETASDVTTLSPLKPDLYQGYFFDKPCSVEEFETNYIRNTVGFRRRQRIASNLRSMDEDRITSFDPNEILTNIGVGLSVMMWDIQARVYEIHPDKITTRLLGMPDDLTPLEYNAFWFNRIKDGYQHYVRKNLRKLNIDTEVVQFMYPWIHPEQGELILSFSGVRSESKNGKTVVKGLHRIVSTVEKIGFDETTRPLKYFVQNRYMDIILNKAIAFMEINVTKNKVEGGMRDLVGTQPDLGDDYLKLTNANGDLFYNEFETWWAGKYLLKCDKDFHQLSNCAYLQKCFEKGETNVEMLCKCLDRNGQPYDCRKSIFITRDEFKGDIMALCVIYDISQETKEKTEFMHRDATIRSLADEYKSIMYINVDEDTVAFYREDKTLGEWKKGVEKHSVMLNVFAERFVSEDDKAEYKYLQSPITMKEMLSKENEYRFEYQRKCKNGEYRYHEVKIKRDDSNPDHLCAIMGVKDIEDEVQLRLQLEDALEMAYTDHLTGLYNQQGLFAKCKEILEDKSVNSAILFMDLDNFKQVNDMYGHGMGDKVLYEVGKAIREETRGKDIVGRYGGDEFVVLIYDIKRSEVAEEVAERIASRINNVCGQLKLQVNISASIGISFTNQTGHDYRYLKEIADDRLYLAKKRGKNQIVKNI